MSYPVEGNVFAGLFSLLVVFLIIQNYKQKKNEDISINFNDEERARKASTLGGDGFVVGTIMLSSFVFGFMGLPREMDAFSFYLSMLMLFLPGALLAIVPALFKKATDQSLVLLFVWVGFSFYIVFGWSLNVWTIAVFSPIVYCFWKRMFH